MAVGVGSAAPTDGFHGPYEDLAIWEMGKAHERQHQVLLMSTLLFKGGAGETAQGGNYFTR